MASTLPAKDHSILIVGAGVFGLSTALHVAQDGYTNITVLDREPVPSPYSAGNDLNKIVRAEYEDPFYTALALVGICSLLTSERLLLIEC
jgi:sarcosine oxidase/L-pipecolate oxidase